MKLCGIEIIRSWAGAEASDLKLEGGEMFLSNFCLLSPNIMAQFHVVPEILRNFAKKNIFTGLTC